MAKSRNALRALNTIDGGSTLLTELRSVRPVKQYELRRIEHVARAHYAQFDAEFLGVTSYLGTDGHAVVLVTRSC